MIMNIILQILLTLWIGNLTFTMKILQGITMSLIHGNPMRTILHPMIFHTTPATTLITIIQINGKRQIPFTTIQPLTELTNVLFPFRELRELKKTATNSATNKKETLESFDYQWFQLTKVIPLGFEPKTLCL